MIDKGRLLDLALSYALDNPAIHFNDPAKVTALREMQTTVLEALRDGIEPVIIAPVLVIPAQARAECDHCSRCWVHGETATAQNDGAQACDRPPTGWYCSRGAGHDGPCNAVHLHAEVPAFMDPCCMPATAQMSIEDEMRAWRRGEVL